MNFVQKSNFLSKRELIKNYNLGQKLKKKFQKLKKNLKN